MLFCIWNSLRYALISFTVQPFFICTICKPPAFLLAILTRNSTSLAFFITSLVPIPVSIASSLILHSSSLSSKLMYTTFFPCNAQFSAKFCINKLLPLPLPPAKILSSPVLNPPYKNLSNVIQPVLF